jgi:23S rRNA (adenine2030-N6)-methyltransferase
MNYRHAFHAGNAGDVLKHVVLAFVLEYLNRKDAPYGMLDSHAGIGLYRLHGTEAERTGEWKAGVGRLWRDRPSGAAGDALAPWYRVLDALNPSGALELYPGSPEIMLRLSRPGDRAIFCELHPEDTRTLAHRYRDDPRARVLAIDGWNALGIHLPLKERRGLVLIDPPFEKAGELARLAGGLIAAHRRFATGTYLAWYPIKGQAEVRGFARALTASGMPKTLRVELHWHKPNHPDRFDGAGVILVNPPYTLVPALDAALPALAERLSTGPGAGHVVETLVGENG